MKRKVFFWLERLKITPAERKTISGLLVLLVLLGSLNMALTPSVPFEEGHYLELEKQFEKRTAALRADRQQLMKQYFPPPESSQPATRRDTVTSDSTDQKKGAKQAQEPQKERININTASQKALESLPGIGPTYARRIIAYRQKNDGFKSIEELKKIKGIAQKRLEKLKPFVKLKGSK